MKLVHLSDLHIGKKLGDYPMKKDLYHVMEQVAHTCADENVDVVVIAGDLYDVSSPSADAMAQVDSILRLLASSGARIVVTPGNHDSAIRVGYMSSFLEDAGITVVGSYDGHVHPVVLEDEFGPISIWPIPYVRPSDVRCALGMERGASLTYDEAMAMVIDALDIDASYRNIAVSHQFVTSGSLSPQEAGSEMSLGGTDAVSASVYDVFDYVALGHIHRPQQIGRETIRYSGSPLKYSKGEARGSKWFPLVAFGQKGDVDIRRIELEPLHDVRVVKGRLADLVSNDVLEGADRNDYVFATVTDEAPAIDARAQLRQAYPNLAGYSVENSFTRSAEDEIDLDAMDAMSPYELFGEFFERQIGRSMTAEQQSHVARKLEELEA